VVPPRAPASKPTPKGKRRKMTSHRTRAPGRGRGLRWTEREIEVTRKWFPLRGGPYVVRLLGRSLSAVNRRARSMGVNPDSRWTRWTEHEDTYIRRWYLTVGKARVAGVLDRTPASVLTRAQSLGLLVRNVRVWKQWEREYVRRHYMKKQPAGIARTLSRTVESIKQCAKHLGIRKHRSKKAVKTRMAGRRSP